MMREGEIRIRKCEQHDLPGISEVCCRCGYGGEDIRLSGCFEDRKLFAMLFSLYYARYERPTCFVAVPSAEPQQVVGYILGCLDTNRYEKEFARRMVPRIAARVVFVTSWRYPQTLRELLRWGRHIPWREANPAGVAYQAHLHIDVLPEYQRRGIGGRLLTILESKFRELGIGGIHLVTSNYHHTALPFYAKHGYRIIRERKHRMWSDLDDYRSIVYVKRLQT